MSSAPCSRLLAIQPQPAVAPCESRAALAGPKARCARRRLPPGSDLPSGTKASAFLGAPLRPRLGAVRQKAPGSSVRHAPTQCGLVQKVSARELEALLAAEERALPLVIDFYATWCGPCILLSQQLDKLAVEYHGSVQFVKVDTDEEYDLANQLEIRGLPTLVFVSKDKEKLAKRTEGILPVETLKELIEEL